jgi:hypothetical protein
MALSDKLNILFPMSIDESSLTVTPSPETTLPAASAFNVRTDKFMRVMGTTAAIKFNAIKLDVMSGIALGHHNLEEGSTIRVRLYDGFNQTGSVTHDSTALSSGTIKPFGEWVPGVDPVDAEWQLGDLLPQVYFYRFDQVTFKSIQIDIAAPSNTQIDIGRIMPGFVFEPQWNYEWGSKWEWIEDGDDITASSTYRQFTFDLSELTNIENDRYEYEKMKTTKQGDLLLCLQPSATGLERLKNTAICKRANNISRTRTRANTNKHSDTFKEVTR